MITRFDHCVIGARDLDQASDAFQRLGFDVRPGGRHTGLGTHNAIIRFGLDYLELLATHDTGEAARSGNPGLVINELLHDRPGGLLGFALASSNLDDEVARGDVPALGYVIGQPFGMQRARPDGHVLSCRLLVPGQHTWRRPWPFLIEWATPDAQRLAWDGIGHHPNGVTSVAGVTIATRNLDAIENLYRNQLGLTVVARDEARHMRVQLPDGVTIHLIDTKGEGLVELRLRVSDLPSSRHWFASHGIQTKDRSPSEFAVTEALGAQLVFGS